MMKRRMVVREDWMVRAERRRGVWMRGLVERMTAVQLPSIPV